MTVGPTCIHKKTVLPLSFGATVSNACWAGLASRNNMERFTWLSLDTVLLEFLSLHLYTTIVLRETDRVCVHSFSIISDQNQ